MTNLRVLNDAGIDLFRQYLNDLRAGNTVEKPNLDDFYSTEFPTRCDLEPAPIFASKLEMAKYLCKKFESVGIEREDIVFNKGLWSWLGYFWFELLSKDKNGNTSPGMDYRYIFSADWNTLYRHYIWLPYDLLSRHKDEESAALFLSKPLNVQGEMTEQLAGRISMYINTQIVKAAAHLYLDINAKKPKKGASLKSDKPGTFRRFIMVLKQAEKTFDIASANELEILDLLPGEFDRWK